MRKRPLVWESMIGQKYNRLTVLAKVYRSKKLKRYILLVECECGNRTLVGSSDVKNGHTRSCGCLQKEVMANYLFRHGFKYTPEYNTWCAMKQRCYCPSVLGFKYYGGRSIRMCDRWFDSFEAFLEDMGPKPKPKKDYSIDRIDNNGDYGPGNCRWATRKRQANNKRNNHLVTFNGKTHTVHEWADAIGINEASFRNRLKTGWTIEEAILTPKLGPTELKNGKKKGHKLGPRRKTKNNVL